MLKLVNEELMSYATIVTEEKGKCYTKIKVVSCNKVQQYENDPRYSGERNRGNENSRKDHSGKKIVSNIDALKPINREILRISAPLTKIEEFENQSFDAKTVEFDLPMSINVSDTMNNRQPKVEVRCHEHGDDRANLYVIAFPFNGMIKPIPDNPQYRIYKGLIATSAKPFFFNNRRYRKVLYLVLEINKNLFNPEHKYHAEEINFQLESYGLFTDQETQAKKTNCETFVLKILSPEGDYVSTWNYEIADKPILMSVDAGQKLWTTYEFNKKEEAPKNTNFKNNKSKKPMSYEGDMMVTVNRHGIRKEIPMRNNKRPKQNRSKYEDKMSSIDKMIMDSGMYENDYDNRSRKNGGKNRGKGKRNNRY